MCTERRGGPSNASVFDVAPLQPFPSVDVTWADLCKSLWILFFLNQGVTDNISSNPEPWMIFNKHPHLEDSLQSVLLLLLGCFSYFVTDMLGTSKGPTGDTAGNGSDQ